MKPSGSDEWGRCTVKGLRNNCDCGSFDITGDGIISDYCRDVQFTSQRLGIYDCLYSSRHKSHGSRKTSAERDREMFGGGIREW